MCLSACALTVDKVDIPYHGPANQSVVAGANTAKVQVVAIEARSVNKDRVSVKKNGYGMEMANIVATNDIPQTIGSAVERELSSLGYTVGTGGCRVDVEISRFYSDFKSGFFSGDAVADAAVNVKVFGVDGKIAYAKSYVGNGIEPDIQLASGSNARAALMKAMSDVVGNIVNDKQLQAAILAAQPPRDAGRPTS